jgi:hypothetical protein
MSVLSREDPAYNGAGAPTQPALRRPSRIGYHHVVQRREHARYKLWFPVQVQAGGQAKVAISRNIGAGGMLVALCADVKLGELVSITFRLPTGGEERTLRGTIVRLDPNTEDPDGEWPFKAGVAFDEVSQDLIPYLEDAVSRFGG